jgi:hypothetical protein
MTVLARTSSNLPHQTIPLLAERICFQMIVLYGCNFANDYINTLRKKFFYIEFCGQTKNILRVRVRPTSMTVTSGHGMILMLSATPGMKSASVSPFWMESLGTLPWAPPSNPNAPRFRDLLETVLPGPLEDVHLAVRQKLWFQHFGAPAHCG